MVAGHADTYGAEVVGRLLLGRPVSRARRRFRRLHCYPRATRGALSSVLGRGVGTSVGKEAKVVGTPSDVIKTATHHSATQENGYMRRME